MTEQEEQYESKDKLDFDFERDKNKKDEYDPIKLPKDGKQAEAVVWSTSVLNRAVDGINKGLPLKANPFIGKNTQLLKPDLVYKRTKEEVEDYIHCMKDPLFFAEKCYIKMPDGMKPCKLRDYQKQYIMHLVKNRFSILRSCRQAGKSFSFLTNLQLHNKKTNKHVTIPFYKLYHKCNKNKTVFDYIKYYIYNIIYNINK